MSDSTDTLSVVREYMLPAGELVGILFTGIVIGVWGAIKNKKISLTARQKRERRFTETHTQVHELLTELRVTVRACRALIFQFHNGGLFADGSSIKRFSVTHESCAAPAQSMILESQDVLLTRYTDILPIMDNQSGKIIAVRDLPISAFRSGLEINSVEYFSMIRLVCDDGLTPLGFLVCQWCSSDPLDEIEKEGISQNSVEQIIRENCRIINTYLTDKKGL